MFYGNCPMCEHQLIDIYGEIKCLNCGYLNRDDTAVIHEEKEETKVQ